jgi:putative endonuclease
MTQTGTLRWLWRPRITLRRLSLDIQEWATGKFYRLPRPQLAPHLETGLAGERAALFELGRRGYVVVARRWTSTRYRGDLDLIAWQGGCLCFIEVKTRTAHDIAPAESAVDLDKRRTLRTLARAYLRGFPDRERATIPTRFDVVSVYLLGGRPEFQFFPAAFSWE